MSYIKRSRSSGGQAIILGVLLLSGLVFTSSLAMDIASLVNQKGRLQAVAEVAALSAIGKKNDGTAAVLNAAQAVIADNLGESNMGNHSITIEYPYNGTNEEIVYVSISKPLSNSPFLMSDFFVSGNTAGRAYAHFSGDNSNWPEFQRDAESDGYNVNTQIAPPLQKLFTYETSGFPRSQVAIYNRIGYLTSSTHLHAVDLITGQEQWKVDIGSASGCAPTVHNGKIYIGTNSNSAVFYCFNTSGAVLWQTAMRKIGTNCGLAVNDQYVFINSSDDGRLYVLNADTGAIVIPNPVLASYYNPPKGFLNTGIAGPGSFGGFSKPAFWNNSLIYTADVARVAAYDVNTFAQLWSRDLSGIDNAVLDGVCVYQNAVYLGGSKYAFGLDAANGNTLWTYLVNLRCTSPAAYDGIVVLGSEERITGLNSASGALVWQYIETEKAKSFSTPAIANGNVYAINDNSKSGLHVVDLYTGALVWKSEDKINIYYRDCAPSIGYGKVVCPGHSTKQKIVYGPSNGNKPRLITPPA